MSENNYQPPKVWEWKQNNGGAFANINRPVSGATHEKTLPVGKHPLQLYSLGTPNGQKVTIMLEELLAQGVKGAEYDAWLISIHEGAQFGIYPFVLALADDALNEAFLHSTHLNPDQKKVLARYTKEDNLQAQKNLKAMEKNFKIVYMGEEQLLRDLEKHLQDIFGHELKYILAPEAYVGCYFLTLLHKDADKSHGIQSVSEYMGFDMKKLTVFGDNFNDLGMFALANTAVAMANAQEAVKEKADIVLAHTNDEDGVARYLDAQNDA